LQKRGLVSKVVSLGTITITTTTTIIIITIITTTIITITTKGLVRVSRVLTSSFTVSL
jgi:hypothetical protein